MASVRSIKNQYQGINAHLHSFFHREGGWDGFHANHIADLMRLMSAQLLPMGYVADIQESLQIRRQKLKPYRAVVFHKYAPGEGDLGQPVAWIELLSPSNKPGGQDGLYYLSKRWKLLHSGIVFAELDYLQESPPTFDKLPRYGMGRKHATSESGSHPYHIVVVDPRPVFPEGKAYPHPFDVDQPVPTVEIPLNRNDVLRFDFGAAYNKTFKETLYGRRFVDYSQLPLDFDDYSHVDQARIVNRMVAVLTASKAGKNLEAEQPFPVKNHTLEKGLAELEKLGK